MRMLVMSQSESEKTPAADWLASFHGNNPEFRVFVSDSEDVLL